MSDSNIRLLVL